MPSSDPAIGFGQLVTGGAAATTTTTVTDVRGLRDAVNDLGRGNTATVIELNGTGDYDFEGRMLQISASNLTIRAGTRAVLKNVRFAIDLDRADNILIQDLIFRNNGSDKEARDAITMEVSDPSGRNRDAVASTEERNVRVTHCSFNGYFDIAIDTKSAVGKPRLFMTIDHCLFFDKKPGKKGDNNSTFVNRGAINISARSSHNADSRVTIANNVYVNVWRRSPRVAGGNFVHVFNNLLYHPGFTLNPTNDTTWRGIEVGGGDRDPDGSKALIQANRFIPAQGKPEVITTNRTTTTDITSAPLNEFDDPAGHPGAQLVLTSSQAGTLAASSFYSTTRPAPTVPTLTDAEWLSLVASVGSPVTDADTTAARQIVTTALTAAMQGGT